MKLSLPQEKVQKLKEFAWSIISTRVLTIRALASFLGLINSVMIAVKFGKLSYRLLEKVKTEALKRNHGDFDTICKIPDFAIEEVKFWANITPKDIGVPIKTSLATQEMFTDASFSGWGATMKNQVAAGTWSRRHIDQCEGNINALEILAVTQAMVSFHKLLQNKSVLVRSDNSTAVSYINNMGGIGSDLCNKLAKELWLYAKSQNIDCQAAHIPGKNNKQADYLSRLSTCNTEWDLTKENLNIIRTRWGEPDIDMFANNLKLRPHDRLLHAKSRYLPKSAKRFILIWLISTKISSCACTAISCIAML